MKDLRTCYTHLKEGSKILDVGCFGFTEMKFSNKLRPSAFIHYGVDYCDPETIPPQFHFKKANLNLESLPFENDFFDFIVAKHIIEHLTNPIFFFQECIRVCKPGGLLYFEAPSERSLLLPGMPFQMDKFFSLSFFDDPTHQTRPWSPQAFYRLTKLHSCDVIKIGYLTSLKHRLLFPLTLPYALLTRNGKLLEKIVWKTIGWASFLICAKPQHISGIPPFSYYIPKR